MRNLAQILEMRGVLYRSCKSALTPRYYVPVEDWDYTSSKKDDRAVLGTDINYLVVSCIRLHPAF
jgi:hypothetical protein